MRFSHFFIDRPIFASVISILVTLVGVISFLALPITEYPQIAPPTVVVNAAMWGQSDSIYTAGLLGCVALVVAGRPHGAMVAYAVAVAFKLHAIFLAPVLVGWIVARRIPVAALLWIPALYAHPDAFGRGAGPALMDAALEEIRERGYREAILWMLDGNARAAAFYERSGWTRDGGARPADYPGVTFPSAAERPREIRFRRPV